MSWLETARKCVADHSCVHLDPDTGEVVPEGTGVLLDVQSAHAVVTVHDALSPTNAAKLAAMPVIKAVNTAWKLINKHSKEN